MGFYEESMKEIEEKRYSKSLLNFCDLFHKARDQAYELGHTETSKKFQYELDVLSLCTPFIGEKNKQRFIPSFHFVDGQVWPDVTKFSSEQFLYYKERLERTTNVFLKTRYADFLFEYGDKKLGIKKFEMAKILVPSCLEVARLHFAHNEGLEMVKYLSRAVEVSLKMRLNELIKECLVLLETILKEYDSTQNYRFVLELSSVARNIINNKKTDFVSGDQKLLFFNILDRGREYFWSTKDFYLHRMFCEEILKWEKIIRLADSEIRKYLLEIGQSFEEEAIDQQGREKRSRLVEAEFLGEAMRHYANIGETEKANDMKVKIRKLYECLEENEELFKVLSNFSVPTEEVECVLNHYLEGEKKRC